MAQPYFPNGADPEEKPQAMQFDGWGFVPLPENDVTVAPAQVETDSQTKAPA